VQLVNIVLHLLLHTAGRLNDSSRCVAIMKVNIAYNCCYTNACCHTQTGSANPCMVVLNGGLDKVRGGYYPRLFYPGLHAAKDKFLKVI
jgi:hypothetical protein